MKDRYAAEFARKIATTIVDALRPACSRIEIAGSLRRRHQTVGDIEIVYVSRVEEEPDPADLFATVTVTLAERAIEGLQAAGILERRTTILGTQVYGRCNKLMLHRATQIPVDLFATTEGCWWNYLVCRTGSARNNAIIASAAKRRGWRWHPYGVGFERLSDGLMVEMVSEEDVFVHVGLPYREPRERE